MILYKKINIENLNLIQNEVLEYLSSNTRFLLDNGPSGFNGINTLELKLYSFHLKNFLEKYNLFNRWKNTGISVIESNSSLQIHTDSILQNRIYALNIPIENCENSYTVWYQKKNNLSPKFFYYNTNDGPILYFNYEPENVNEIDRIESKYPVFVNVKEPHKGESFNQNKRILISLRFTPELTEKEILLFS